MITVAIIGAGPLGRWLASASAQAGFHVFLEDVMPANLHHAQEYIRQQIGPSSLGQSASSQADSSVHFVSSIEQAVRTADLVIDCVPDELESKLEILFLLDRMAPPRAVLATPTAHLSIADLAACTYRPDRCVAIAADPRHMAEMPSSEIHIKTIPTTAGECVELVRSFWRGLGFMPTFEVEAGVLPVPNLPPA